MNVPLSRLPQFAQDVCDRIAPRSPGARAGAFLVFLQGDLGAGKTTFMQHFARALGIGEAIQSPTFVLMKQYSAEAKGYTRLVHIDAYRLAGAEEFEALKPEQFLRDPSSIVCVEWPERVREALPKPDLVLKFSHNEGEETTREIEIET